MNDICYYNNYCKESGANVWVTYPCVYRLQNINNLLTLITFGILLFLFYIDLIFQFVLLANARILFFRSQH